MNQAIAIIDYSHIAGSGPGPMLLFQGLLGVVLAGLLVGVVIRGVAWAESKRQTLSVAVAGGVILALLLMDFAWVKADYRDGRSRAQDYLAAELQVPVVNSAQYSRLHATGREVAIDGSRLCGGNPIVAVGSAGESKIFVLHCMEVADDR